MEQKTWDAKTGSIHYKLDHISKFISDDKTKYEHYKVSSFGPSNWRIYAQHLKPKDTAILKEIDRKLNDRNSAIDLLPKKTPAKKFFGSAIMSDEQREKMEKILTGSSIGAPLIYDNETEAIIRKKKDIDDMNREILNLVEQARTEIR